MLETDVTKSPVPAPKYLKRGGGKRTTPRLACEGFFVCLIHLKRTHVQRIETCESIGSTLMNLQELGFGEGGEDYLNIFKNWELQPK